MFRERLLDTGDRNGSTSGPTPWQIYDDDDDDYEDYDDDYDDDNNGILVDGLRKSTNNVSQR